MFFIKFDVADKNAIYHSLIYDHNDKNKSMPIRLQNTLYFLTYPFQSEHFIMRFASGKMFESYLSKKNERIKEQIQSNLFWAYTFEKHDIPHLSVVAQCDKVHCTEYKTIHDDKYYTEKQEVSNDSKQVEGIQIHLVPGENKVWFENLDCQTDVSIFRIITLPHKIFAIWNLNLKKKESKFEWNVGDTKFQCFTNCDTTLFDTKKDLLKMCKQLLGLHAKEFKDVLNLNWEVACCGEKCIALGGNAHLFDFDTEMIKDYKQEYMSFVH